VTADIDVTVVIPVYNPGPAIESCIESLLEQTLPAERLQVIFSDDGSTDGTGERLDRVAAAHAHVQVIHSPNSGWPGRPRNLGIEAAHGEYIQFVDHDDSMAPEALERLVAYGRANAADIVIGRVTSNFRPTPNGLFRANHPACTIRDAALIDSLTPHKMFRRQFLLDTGIRYPEGKVRLEDQLFMVKTYFAARSVSVLSDYPCYFYRRRPEGEHAADEAVDPFVYYGYLREVLDVIAANTEPGEFRDGLYRRFYRTMVRRACNRVVSSQHPADYVDAYVSAVTSINADYFAAGVADGLPPLRRAQSAALMAGRRDEVIDLTERSDRARGVVTVDAVGWTGAAWTATLTLRLALDDGCPVVVVPSGDGYRLDPRIIPAETDVRAESRAELLARCAADVVVRERGSGMRWFAPGEFSARLEPVGDGEPGVLEMVYTGEVTLDPLTLAMGHPLSEGTWDLAVHYDVFGLRRQVPVRLDEATAAALRPVLFRPPARVVRPTVNANGRLSLLVQPPAKSVSAVMQRYLTGVTLRGHELSAPIAVSLVGGPATTKCEVLIGADGPRRPATITATAGGAELRCDLGRGLSSGEHSLALQVKPADRPQPLAVLTAGRLGRLSVDDARSQR
jgi:glycosyltransferase involved in cell wall biosynthesis